MTTPAATVRYEYQSLHIQYGLEGLGPSDTLMKIIKSSAPVSNNVITILFEHLQIEDESICSTCLPSGLYQVFAAL